jgi:glyoxylase-like metal-dependent hydrolase (beta-lactamase superfamily II)
LRAIGLHADVIVLTSRVWRTACTAIRAGDEAFVVDSLVYPDELELLPTVLDQADFPFSGLLATHADWDHLLGRLAFPGASLGVAETTAAQLTAEPGAPQRELRAFDERHYVERVGPLSLGQLDALPVPGYCAIGGRELELHPADGHTVDGMAIWAAWAGVLICGDYLSPAEIPTVGGSVDSYLATLERLAPLVASADYVVAGHGGGLPASRAAEILREDRAYLESLRSDPSATPLPPGRAGVEQRRLHAANLARV